MAVLAAKTGVRRHFYELAAAGPAPIATEVLERNTALDLMETEIRGQDPGGRRAARRERAGWSVF